MSRVPPGTPSWGYRLNADLDEIEATAVAAKAGTEAHAAKTAGAHPATAVTVAPVDGITATDAQAAIAELAGRSQFVARVWDGAAWPGRESDGVVHWIDPLGTSTPPAEARLGDVYSPAK